MTQFHIYIACTVDGLIADKSGGISWLDEFTGENYGYNAFYEGINALVMGRKTFEQVLTFGSWPYAGKQTYVLSSRPISHESSDVRAWTKPITDLAEKLTRKSVKCCWVVGGGETIRKFIELGLINRIELFTMPILLGLGMPLFLPQPQRTPLQFVKSMHYANGVVKTVYEQRTPAPSS